MTTLENARVGTTASLTRTILEHDVATFAMICGDDNPLHLDAEYAASARFGKCIAHGMILGGYISALLGTQLPGPGTIYLSQEMRFCGPAYIGDTITTLVEVLEVRQDKPVITLSTKCFNQHGNILIDGKAVVLASLDTARNVAK